MQGVAGAGCGSDFDMISGPGSDPGGGEVVMVEDLGVCGMRY